MNLKKIAGTAIMLSAIPISIYGVYIFSDSDYKYGNFNGHRGSVRQNELIAARRSTESNLKMQEINEKYDRINRNNGIIGLTLVLGSIGLVYGGAMMRPIEFSGNLDD